MKKILLTAVAVILFLCILVFCKKYFINETPQADGEVIRNCKIYLWKQKPINFFKIDFQYVTVRKAVKQDYEQAESVTADAKPVEGDITVQIGNTQGNDFRILLLDSASKIIVGEIPIK
ncbi:hypothetical protein [Anaerostipes sp.]|uniref:hypothetical protein n=1 Tax=Anaerostipes sp. TaxID=1872530 RepID=UPI0025C0D8F0|nr:hypothetical protein [Anaerostipes sp.]MBS7009077.1 hypothetical protein [Anaerostipes sp.]